MKIKLTRNGSLYGATTVPFFDVFVNDTRVGSAYKARGVYFMGLFSGSHTRLLQYIATLAL